VPHLGRAEHPLLARHARAQAPQFFSLRRLLTIFARPRLFPCSSEHPGSSEIYDVGGVLPLAVRIGGDPPDSANRLVRLRPSLAFGPVPRVLSPILSSILVPDFLPPPPARSYP
jgi:hypothetical protein